jgi:hypothetical protein
MVTVTHITQPNATDPWKGLPQQLVATSAIPDFGYWWALTLALTMAFRPSFRIFRSSGIDGIQLAGWLAGTCERDRRYSFANNISAPAY